MVCSGINRGEGITEKNVNRGLLGTIQWSTLLKNGKGFSKLFKLLDHICGKQEFNYYRISGKSYTSLKKFHPLEVTLFYRLETHNIVP